MKASDVMMRFPRTVVREEEVSRAAEIMAWAGIRHLPVVQEDRLVGLVTQRELVVHKARHGDAACSHTVDAIMVPRPQTASPEDSVTEIAGRMADGKLGCLPVVELGKVIGIVTTTDILASQVRAAMSSHDTEPSSLRVFDVMTGQPEAAHPSDHLLDAAARMQQKRIRHLPVVNGDGHVIGMLSDRDVRAAIGDPTRPPEDTSVMMAEMRVADAMSTPAISTDADRPLSAVAREFISLAASAVPVTDAEGVLIGMLSYIDVLRGLTQPR